MESVIKTKRLLITLATAEEMRALIANEPDEGMKIAYGEMLTLSEAYPNERHWYGAWHIKLNSGERVGDLCFKGLSDDGTVEIGCGLLPEHWGQGYATEAVQSMVTWASRQTGVRRIEGETEPDNRPSQRVLEKCGFVPTGEMGEEGPRFVWTGEKPQKRAVIYIHGKGGTIEEADHYRPLFSDWDVIGFDYHSDTPWEAKAEFSIFFDTICPKYDEVILIANSIGAFFALNTEPHEKITKAFLISPVVDMERLIGIMMTWANVTEEELCQRREIPTAFGETLSWTYLTYVREHPITWNVPTHILYAEKDNLTSFETISAFSQRHNATLTVMKNGEHWFHTEAQMDFLDNWLRERLKEVKS